MGKRIVIALGGNALGKNLHEQMDAVKVTAKAIADLIEDGHEVGHDDKEAALTSSRPRAISCRFPSALP